MSEINEEALDKAAREGYAIRCKTNGPRTLAKYASDDIMAKQLADARVIVAAYQAALAVEQESVATVVWYDPRTDMLLYERPHKIIDASLAFIEAAPIGTKLYSAPVAAPVQVKALAPVDVYRVLKEASKNGTLDEHHISHLSRQIAALVAAPSRDDVVRECIEVVERLQRITRYGEWIDSREALDALRLISGDTSNG